MLCDSMFFVVQDLSNCVVKNDLPLPIPPVIPINVCFEIFRSKASLIETGTYSEISP